MKELPQDIENVGSKLLHFFELKAKHLKLKGIKIGVDLGAVLIHYSVIIIFCVIFYIFLNMSLAFLFSKIFGEYYIGFGIVCLLNLLFILCLLFFKKKKIQNLIKKKLIQLIFKDNEQ